MKQPTLLIVDDDQRIRFAFKKTFESLNYKTLEAADGKEALQLLAQEKLTIIFMDIMMPNMDGLEVLKEIKKENKDIPVIMITGYGTMHTAMKAIQLGAYEYLTKPLAIDKVRLIAERALEMVRLRKALQDMEERSFRETKKFELVGKSEKMQEVYKKMGAAAASPNTTNILIQGESGTGKELVARAIHFNGENAKAPFVAVNCTALPEGLFESELFGYEKGAFTGAVDRKTGYLEKAGNGTIFLDEIGDLSLHLQQKLLRVIQEREISRVGSTDILPIKARFIAATNHNLEKEVNTGNFRKDLYYRLNVMVLDIPTLRERGVDIALLANFFLDRFNKKLRKNIKIISNPILSFLNDYSFPGNVRELENMIERAVILEQGDVLSFYSFENIFQHHQKKTSLPPQLSSTTYQAARSAWLAEFEKRFVKERLKTHQGNVTAAAQEARIKRQSFQRLLKKHNIRSKDFKKG